MSKLDHILIRVLLALFAVAWVLEILKIFGVGL